MVHQDAADKDVETIPTAEALPSLPPASSTKADQFAPAPAAALPPKVPERSASAPRGILRPPVYSHSKSVGTNVVEASEQPSSHIPSQPTSVVTAASTSNGKAAPPVAVAQTPSTSFPAVGDNAIDSDEEVDADFQDFMNELMEEVAPDHTEVRCCVFVSFIYAWY